MASLRDLLTGAEAPAPTDRDQADQHARQILGPDLAGRIVWDAAGDDEGRLGGQLAGDDATLLLRFVPDWEPGTAHLQVRVPCPSSPMCNAAYDAVRRTSDLLGALDDGEAGGDPQCDVHDDY